MLIISIVLGFLLSPASNQSSACDDFAGFKQLLKGPPESRYEYRGRYINRAYEFSVRIPKGVTAYDGRDQARHNGFALGLGKVAQSVIFASADPNSMQYNTPREAAMGDAEGLRQVGKKIESETITESHLGTLDAVRLVVIYTCPGSADRYIQSSITALSPDKRFVYRLRLYSHANRYENDRTVLNRVIRSWTMIRISRQPRRR